MLKLLIVDDQKPVREGLKASVDWNGLGYQVVGDVESAKLALEIIESECVDVILTDIVMPEVNGLGLIKEIKKINPSIKAVILSGYNEFQYAKEAVRLGAYDYLTKPVVFSELKRIFTEIKRTLELEDKEREKIAYISESARERFLNNLSKGYFTNSDRKVQIRR